MVAIRKIANYNTPITTSCKESFHEWNRKLVSPSGREPERRTAAVYDRPLRHRQTEFGDSLDRRDLFGHLPVSSRGVAQFSVLGAGLCVHGLGAVSQLLPQHLQAVSGKPQVHKPFGAAEGSGTPLFCLPQVPPAGAGAQGQGQGGHHLSQMSGKVRKKDLKCRKNTPVHIS